MCHRIPELLKNGRFYGHTLWIHSGTEGTHRSHPRRRPHSAKPLMEPPPKHQVQRHFLYHPTGGRSHLYSGRQKANTGNHPVLYGQCPYHERGTGKYWAESLRRSQRSLPLGENPEWNKLLEILRPTALRSKRGRYAGHRLQPSGEGYIRLTAFGERHDCIEAMRRIKQWI